MNLKTLSEFVVIRQFYEGGDLNKQDPLRQVDRFLDETIMNLAVQQNFEIFEEHGPIEGAALSMMLQFGTDVNVRETGAERDTRKAEEEATYIK